MQLISDFAASETGAEVARETYNARYKCAHILIGPMATQPTPNHAIKPIAKVTQRPKIELKSRVGEIEQIRTKTRV